MVADKGRRRFLESAGAAAFASCLPAVSHTTGAAEKKSRGSQKTPALRPFGFVMHGGAGTIERSKMTQEREKAYRDKLTEALLAGFDVLKRDGQCLDAVVTAITLLEDSPLFNAGKGAVFTSAGTNELDASIMDGRTLMAGSVAGLKHIKNPISLARMVMEKSPHVMMAGDGAETFAKQQGVALVPQSYFYTERRWKEWRAKVEEERSKPPKKTSRLVAPLMADEDRHGTVGAVALDKAGNLAAGTSTGGITNKKFGRIGDSPIIGAGTYANNQTCAISTTGDGEFFIRSVVAHDISALVGYKGMSVKDAADAVLDKVKQLGGTGGVIVLDREGRVAMSFNTAGMYRGFIGPDGKAVIEIYKD